MRLAIRKSGNVKGVKLRPSVFYTWRWNFCVFYP